MGDWKESTSRRTNQGLNVGLNSASPDMSPTQAAEDLNVFHAYEIAANFNLPWGVVTRAWKMFKRYDTRGVGVLQGQDFQLLLRSELRDVYPSARDIPRELFKRCA